MWDALTDERLTKFITYGLANIWPSAIIIREVAMPSHSDPYPKMPWQSGDSGGSHRSDGSGGGGSRRDPSGARASHGCLSMMVIPVVGFVAAIVAVFAFFVG